MKILYTLIIVLFCCGSSYAQWQRDTFRLTFSDTASIDTLYYSDTILDPHGIWVIDTPRKAFFDTAYTQAPAVMTLRDSMLMPGSRASFIISLPPSQYGRYPMGALFTFRHKYQFDRGKAGGYVEFSVDSGRHWHGVYRENLGPGFYYYNFREYLCLSNFMDAPDWVDSQSYVFAPRWWPTIPPDTTSSGVACFTGTDCLWRYDTIVFPTIIPYKTLTLTPMMMRFTAYADSNATPTAGWIIDNINFQDAVMVCMGGINEINSSHLHIYPEPVAASFTMSMTNMPHGDYELSLSDLAGRVLLTQKMTEEEMTLHRGNIAAGSYIIQVRDALSGSSYQKRVVFE